MAGILRHMGWRLLRHRLDACCVAGLTLAALDGRRETHKHAGWPALRLAFCGLRPLVLQGEVSPCEPLCPRPSWSSFTKANNAYAAKGHPCPWPLVWNHPNDAIGFGKLRAGPNGLFQPPAPQMHWVYNASSIKQHLPSSPASIKPPGVVVISGHAERPTLNA